MADEITRHSSERPVRFTIDPLGGIDLGDVPESLRNHLQSARDLAERSLAPGTLENYRGQWNRWEAWCERQGFNAREIHPVHVMAWIVELTERIDDPASKALRPVSIGPVVAALDRAAKTLGVSPPSQDAAVRTVLAGIRRTGGMAPINQRTPIELNLLTHIVDGLASGTGTQARDAALVALRGNGLTLGQLAGRESYGLRWESLSLGIDGVTVTPLGGRGPRGPVLLDGIDAEQIERFRASTVTDGELFDMTRAGISAAIKRLVEASGQPSSAELCDQAVRDRVYGYLDRPTNAAVRDIALMSVGWWAALRRSELVSLRWSDITPHGGGLDIVIRVSKTDQEGHGETVWLPPANGSGFPCPVKALLMWAERIRDLTGVNPVDSDQPVFTPVNRHDHVSVDVDDGGLHVTAMTGQAVDQVVVRAVRNAGVDPTKFGSHSLRAGFITSAFEAGVQAADIQHTTRHKSLDVLFGYNRPTERRNRSAAARIHQAGAANPTPRPATPETTSRRTGPPQEFMP